jgi:hypothetical protein
MLRYILFMKHADGGLQVLTVVSVLPLGGCDSSFSVVSYRHFNKNGFCFKKELLEICIFVF